MKNAFQELIKSTNKEDQASCEIQDLEEESSNRMEGLKKEIFSGYPSNTSYEGTKKN